MNLLPCYFLIDWKPLDHCERSNHWVRKTEPCTLQSHKAKRDDLGCTLPGFWWSWCLLFLLHFSKVWRVVVNGQWRGMNSHHDNLAQAESHFWSQFWLHHPISTLLRTDYLFKNNLKIFDKFIHSIHIFPSHSLFLLAPFPSVEIFLLPKALPTFMLLCL